MTAFIIIAVVIIVVLLLVNKFKVEENIKEAAKGLDYQRVSQKYWAIFETIIANDLYFQNYRIVTIAPHQENLCSISNPNVIIMITYYKDKINLEWKYQMFHKEVYRVFSHDANNFTEQQQRVFAFQAFEQMQEVIRIHQQKLGFN